MDPRLDAFKTTSKKVAHKEVEAKSEFRGSKIAEKIVKLDANSRNIEQINSSPEKKMLNELNKYYKMEHNKMSKLLNDSTVSKIVITKWIQLNVSSGCKYYVNKSVRLLKVWC